MGEKVEELCTMKFGRKLYNRNIMVIGAINSSLHIPYWSFKLFILQKIYIVGSSWR